MEIPVDSEGECQSSGLNERRLRALAILEQCGEMEQSGSEISTTGHHRYFRGPLPKQVTKRR